jgi:hypothetical protein
MAMNEMPVFSPVQIVAFRGQRDLANPAGAARALREQLQNFAANGKRALAICALLGPSDFLFAREALALGLPLVVMLPETAEEMKNSLSETVRSEFGQILEKAAKVQVSPQEPDDPNALSLGQKLVDEADVLLAMWEGAENGARDGTAEAMAYASHRGRPVIVLRVGAESVEVRQIKPENEIAHPQIAVEVLQKELGPLPPAPEIPEELTAYFQACDEEASRTAPQVRRHYLNIVLANATASVAGSVDGSFPQTPTTGAILNIIRFGCVLMGLGIFLALRRRQSQNKWLDLRLRAELCRSAIATWLSPRGVHPLTPEEVPELRGLIQAIRYFRAVHRPATPISLEQFKADYGTRRLLDQLSYFRKQADNALKIGTWLTPLYWIFSCLALGTAAGSFIYQTIFRHAFANGSWVNFAFNFVPALAPALASWILAFQAIQAVGRRRARFREMERLMHQALLDLTYCRTEDEVHRLVKHAEKLLLGEVLEWYSFVKYGR